MGSLSGMFWGILVATVVLAAVSLSVPLPERNTASAAADTDADGATEGGAQRDAGTTDDTTEPGGDDTQASEALAPAPASPETDPAPAVPEAAAPETPNDDVDSGAPATEVPLPSGSEFNRPPPEPEAAIPATETAPSPISPAAPSQATESAAPVLDTSPAAQPNVATTAPNTLTVGGSTATSSGAVLSINAARPSIGSGPDGLTQPEASDGPAISTTFAPAPEFLTPQSPEAQEAAGQEAEASPAAVAAPAAPVVDDTASGAVASEVPAVAEVTPDAPTSGDTNTARTLPTIVPPQADAAAETEPRPQPAVRTMETAVLSTPLFPRTSDLPQRIPSPIDGPDPDAEPAAAADPSDGTPRRAIEAFAAPFEPDDARPLMAIVLIDDPDSPIEQSTLSGLSFPVAFAIDPLHPEAEARAQAYRDAGFEVVILGSILPEGATPSDLEQALSGARATLPEAVAVLDTPDSRIQGDRPILDATIEALADSGHGLVAFPRGLNAAEQSANRAGVPAGTLFRMLDDEDQRATLITRLLSRAAFAGGQDGTVIVAGHTRPDTVTALMSWALGERSTDVAIAPLSATLLRASGQ